MKINKRSVWWNEKKNEAHSSLHSTFEMIKNDSQTRIEDMKRHARVVFGKDIEDFDENASLGSIVLPNDRITINITHSMIDTMVNKLGSLEPLPEFSTDGASFSLQRKAKKLSTFVFGMFDKTNIHQKGRMVFQDALVYGTGFMKIFQEGSKICSERVFPASIFVDDKECKDGNPTHMYQVSYVDVDKLCALFPKKEAELLSGIASDGMQNLTLANTPDNRICVLEGWKLGSQNNPGRHVVCTSTCSLIDEEWNCETFPFAIIRWSHPPRGFWGIGLAEQLYDTQMSINSLLREILLSQKLSVPKYFIPQGSNISDAKMMPRIGAIIRYTGAKPDMVVDNAVPKDKFDIINFLITQGYKIAGISEMSSQSHKPAGLDSGKALRTFHDIESERFISVGKELENFYKKAAKLQIYAMKEMYEQDKESFVKIKGKKFIETIKWKDIDLDDDQYVMKIFPVNLLPKTPAGKLATVQEMLNANLITPEKAIKLLDFPDLDAAMNAERASDDYIDKVIEDFRDGKEYRAPFGLENLQESMKRFSDAALENEITGVSEEIQANFLRYLADLQILLTPPPAPPAPPGEQLPPEEIQ